jgi:threonylcarbamoyladenosine tRNA methylthiotransferase MtaB
VTGITDALLDTFAHDGRACPHFHVPLQSGDDGVLRAMRRVYTAEDYRLTAGRIRDRLPQATLGSDIIVGFPGEGEAAFAATCRMVEDLDFANLHIFRFSARSGTDAAHLVGAVPESAKRDRAVRLDSLWRSLRRRLLDAYVGRTEDVLVETQRDGTSRGHTAGYLEATFTSERPSPVGTVCRVRITRATESGLEGVHDEPDRAD